MADLDFGGGKGLNMGDPKYGTDGVDFRTLLRVIELSGSAAASITGTVVSVSQGTKILTGGTAAKPTISTSLTPTFTSVNSTSLSGGTIFSAGTELSTMFAKSGSASLTSKQIGFGSSTNTLSGVSTFTYNNGIVTLGNTSSTVACLNVFGTSAVDTNYDVFKGARYFPRITLQDTWSGGSTHQIWVLGTHMRFGSAAGSSGTAAMIINSGNSGNTMFNGNMVIGGGSVSWESNTRLEVRGHMRASIITGTTYYSESTLLETVISNMISAGGGGISTASNVGSAQEVFKQKNGTDLEFRTISGTNLSVTTLNDNIIIGSSNVRTTSGAQTLSPTFTDYVFNGGGAGTTWTLPTVMTHIRWSIFNIGIGTITLNDAGGAGDIYQMGGT